jgi:hypothetical protein
MIDICSIQEIIGGLGKMKMKKKQLTMSQELCGWYEDKGKEMGVSASSLMVMALQQYIDQQKAITSVAGLQEIMIKLENLQVVGQA